MSTGLYSHTTRGIGTVLTAAIYNADHNNHITNANPLQHGAYSDDINQMRVQVDPGTVGNEILAETLAGELAQLRFVMKRLCGTTYWYEEPPISFTTINAEIADIEEDIDAIEADVAPLKAFRPLKAFDSYDTWTAISAVIPLDDTAPVVSEGVEILSVAVTLTAANSKVRVKVENVSMYSHGVAIGAILAVFRGAVCIGTSVISINTNFINRLDIDIQDIPGDAGPHTYSARVGPSGAGTIYLNGLNTGRMLAGTTKATMFVEEHLA
jgi:hypothetical protein